MCADRAIVSDGIECRSRSQWSAAGADQITHLCLGNTCDAVYGGNYACEAEIDAGGFDCRLACLELSPGRRNRCYTGPYPGLIPQRALVFVVQNLHSCRLL